MACCFLSAFAVVLTFFVILKIFLKLSTGWDRSPTCLIGKNTIVTGANTGIGFYTALDFAKRGARVILACRDKDKAEEAKIKIIEKTGNTNVAVRIVDLASLDSVRKFTKEIKDTEKRLDILVNNAGAGGLENITTEDGLNLLMQINYFGPALLTLLLVDLLKKSASSRIVNVASVMAHFAKLDHKNLNTWPPFFVEYAKSVNYCNSKLCNIIFTNELARKLKGTGVTVNSLHPGAVRTDIFRTMPFVMRKITLLILYLLFKSPEEGAQTSIYVSVSKDIEEISGEYFDNCKKSWLPPMPKAARDKGLVKKVWEETEDHIKLTSEERELLFK